MLIARIIEIKNPKLASYKVTKVFLNKLLKSLKNTLITLTGEGSM